MKPRPEVIEHQKAVLHPATATSAADVTVIVPTWQRSEWLDRCLGGLAEQTRPPRCVFVVGRAEDRPAQRVVDGWQDRGVPVEWHEVSTPGHIPPVLVGLENVTSEFVALLDDDAVPSKTWLANLMQPFEDDVVACVGGHVHTPGARIVVNPDAGMIRWYGKHVGNVAAREGDEPIPVDGVMECNWAWRADVLGALDFDPVFRSDDSSMYGLDLCLQAKELGYQVMYQPAAWVLHAAAPRDRSLNRDDRAARAVTYSRNYTYIALRHLSGVRWFLFWLWWWLVGERGSYGLAAAAIDVLSGREGVSHLVRASLRGKYEGVVAWLRSKNR